MINIPSYKKDPSYRYQMPALKIKVEGKGNGIRTKFLNLFEVARSLAVPPEYPLRFFGAEFGAIIEFKLTEQKAMLNGNLRVEDLQNSLDHFIEKFVLCPKCKYPEINIRIRKGELYSDCKACGEVRKMDMTHKIVNHILKFPPPGATKAPTGKKPEVSVKVKSSKKKSKAINLKGSEMQECIDRISQESDLARSAEILTNVCASKNYESDIRAFLMFKGIFGDKLLTLVKEPAALGILKQYSTGCAEDFLMAFASVYGLEEEWKDKVSSVMFHFFNNDLVNEEFFERFSSDDADFNEASPVYNSEALEEVKKNASEFLDWLKNAEVEEGEENEVEEGEEKSEELLENGVANGQGHEEKTEKIEEKAGKIEGKQGSEKSEVKEEKKSEPSNDYMSRIKQMEDFNIDDI